MENINLYELMSCSKKAQNFLKLYDELINMLKDYGCHRAALLHMKKYDELADTLGRYHRCPLH